ncbi:imelysin family protein [Algiphilus sp.]|uniref:imelysin family protein n=1 Tax=Algiphilus sp. TaxID=1872431 RepID=UPI003B51A4DF
MQKTTAAWTAAAALALAACGGGGGGGGGSGGNGGGPALGDDARRMVLADIADNVILPTLRDLDADAAALATAVDAHASADGADDAALTAARNAWLEASDSLQRAEVLQLGPAATSGTGDPQPGAMDIRDQIYSYPDSNDCIVDNSAFADEDVDASTRLSAKGMDALEYLLFFEGENTDCPPPDGVDLAASRASYAAKVARFTADQASLLRQEWEPSGDDFRGTFANAGDGSMTYNRPQDALDALSLALFYVEKQSKDRKIACPTGIGASGLSCPGPDVSRVEYPNARASGDALRANYETFRDVFQGVDGDMGINTLLESIGREDLVQDLNTALTAALDLIDRVENELGGFEAAVEAIGSSDACSSAAGAAEDPAQAATAPLACALQGRVKTVTTIFRADIVNALSLATPQAAAGDND